VAVASNGEVLIADTGSGRIVKLAPAGAALAAWSAPATRGHQPAQGGPIAAPAFREPLAVASGTGGVLYVVDTGNDRVDELDAQGALVASWGGAGAAPGHFEDPDGIAVDRAGDVFVSDGVLDRVQEFSRDGSLLAAWGRAGSGPGELSEPTGLAVDCHGAVLVADTGNNRVQLFTGVATGSSCGR
jgi:DNA-binding beta-propeller fold protein YncE